MVPPLPLRSLLVILSCYMIIPASAEETPRELRVLTYNIHHGEGTDGKLDLERIARVIIEAKADLVALQEVDRNTKRTGNVDQPARFAELTGMQVVFGKAMDYGGGGYGVAILSRWPIESPKTHALPAGPGTEPRAVLSTTIRIGDDAPTIQFLVTHVDHRSDPTARTAQVTKLMELFPPKDDGGPSLLAGDLNAGPSSAVVQALLTEWKDSSAGQSFLTCPADVPSVKIDYILFRPADRWAVVESKALDEAVASDHRPVLSVFRIAAEKQ